MLEDLLFSLLTGNNLRDDVLMVKTDDSGGDDGDDR